MEEKSVTFPDNNYAYRDAQGVEVSFTQRNGSYTMSEQHFHDYYEVYYLLGGSRYYFIKDNTYYIKAGDLVLLDKKDLHRTLETLEKSHHRLLINVRDTMISDPDGNYAAFLEEMFSSGSMILSFSGPNKESMDDLVGRLYAEIRQKDPGYELQIKAYIMELLVFARRHREEWRKEAEETLKQANRRIFDVLSYINSHYMEHLSLETVAQQFFISKFYLSHAFKDVTGFTFVEYLNNVRVREAQRFLSRTNYSVSEIAEKVGFGTVTHFGRVFHKISGVTPVGYRKQERIYDAQERREHKRRRREV